MSKTWLLTTADGDPNFEPGDTDIVWENGRPVEITDPESVLNQRVRKTAQTPLGTNKFEPSLGLGFRRLIGTKGYGDAQVKDLAAAVQDMFDKLKDLQVEALARIDLDPREMIDRVKTIRVQQNKTVTDVAVTVITQGSTPVEATIRGVTNAFS